MIFISLIYSPFSDTAAHRPGVLRKLHDQSADGIHHCRLPGRLRNPDDHRQLFKGRGAIFESGGER